MDSEDEFDMQDAAESADDDFYSGGDDGFDTDDADVADYEFIDNDSDDSDDLISHRHQVLTTFLTFLSTSSHLPVRDFPRGWWICALIYFCVKGLKFNSCNVSLQQNYTILSEADIRQRQDEDIMRISTVLSISNVEASILLRYYNWYTDWIFFLHHFLIFRFKRIAFW